MLVLPFAIVLLAFSSVFTFSPETLGFTPNTYVDAIWMAHFGLLLVAAYTAWQLSVAKKTTLLLSKQQEESLSLHEKLQKSINENKKRQAELQDILQEKESLIKKEEMTRHELEKHKQLLAEKEKHLLALNQKLSWDNPSEEGQAEVVNLLGLLQKQGRFLDFVMNDITQYSDQQVSTASRIVHQGCSKVLKEYFDIQPVFNDPEGSSIQLSSSTNPRYYRMLGQDNEISSQSAPDSAYLLHKGWQTLSVNLPKRVKADQAAKRLISPAELEIRN